MDASDFLNLRRYAQAGITDLDELSGLQMEKAGGGRQGVKTPKKSWGMG
jgi:hypothetical protein